MGDMRRTPYKPPIPVASKYTGKEAIEASSYGFCAHCGRGDAKAKCGNCSQVAYCGKECQRAAWKEHKLSGYCVPHCNICAGPTRNPCKTLPCKHKICGLCYDECKRLGCGGYCAKCDKFHLPSHPDDEGDRAMRCGALKDFLVAERMDRTIRERSRTMGMTKDESQRFAAWLRSGTNRCDVALEKDPADQHVHCVLGMIKRSQGDAVNAAASFGDCLEIEPSHPAANFYMGLIAMKNGDHCAATRRFQHAIKSDKSHHLRLIVAPQGNLVAAEEAPRRREDATHAAYYNLGCALKDQGRFDEAEGAWRQALKANPQLGDCWANIACCYVQKKDYGRAKECVNKELALNMHHVRARNLAEMIGAKATDHEEELAALPPEAPAPSSAAALKAKALAALEDDSD
ncbi:hypothetical protein JL722_332 [Aureococcus anophagefferens]|nr:hypothetical protein JL722_332 [Aureococcus anophagefferens]